jgi:tetratricopeptide (TPR) repeat protein
MLVASAATILLFGSCSKKLGQFQSDYFTTDPTPLQTVGGGVPATVVGRIPAKFMLKNAKVTATPVLQWEQAGSNVYTGNVVYGEAKGGYTVIQGSDVRANGQVVDYNNGGTVTIPFNVAYSPEMAQSTLYLDFQVDQNGKTYALPRVKVGYGIVATSTLASAATVYPAIAKDDFQKVISEKYSADIHFLINQANVRTSETSKSEYIDLNKRLQEANAAANQEIAGVSVSSYASPEGSLDFNTKLASQREKNTTALVSNQLKKDKITEFGELTSNFTPEDWDGFEKLVQNSNIQDKDLIISVLKMYPDPEQREKEIRNMASVFNELADQVLPQLRYSRVQATINVIGKSDQELIDQFNSDPTKLTAEEILYIATLTDDNMKKMEVYNTAAGTNTSDYRTFNNLGVTQYVAGDYEGAKANFEHALRLNPSAKEPEMNLGLISLLNNDYSKANEQFGAAAGVPELNDALGVYYLSQGEIGKAQSAFGDTKSNNAALAQILAKDYTTAKQTLSSITNPDATTYYLMAVVGARTSNENMVLSNLREAGRLDKNMLTRAKTDLEFSKFNLSYL